MSQSAGQIVSISFFRFDHWSARLWAFVMMGGARRPLTKVPDLLFWKLCGAGKGEGFTPTVKLPICAILCTWTSEAAARRQLASNPLFQRYRARAGESWTVFLAPTDVRGNWSGTTPFVAETAAPSGPLAALTRATVRPSKVMQFWRRVPQISQVIGSDPNVVFKIGIGEVPLLQQVTFSIWPDATAMANFARKDGPHARAIRAVRTDDWFREELYARFSVTGDIGTWGGSSPLKRLEHP